VSAAHSPVGHAPLLRQLFFFLLRLLLPPLACTSRRLIAQLLFRRPSFLLRALVRRVGRLGVPPRLPVAHAPIFRQPRRLIAQLLFRRPSFLLRASLLRVGRLGFPPR